MNRGKEGRAEHVTATGEGLPIPLSRVGLCFPTVNVM